MSQEQGQVAGLSTQSDEDLLESARAGSSAAYGELWRRHAGVGKAIARQFSGPDLADDLVAEAFVRILSTIQRGGGPVSGFRPYLITTIRNVAKRWAEKPKTIDLEFVDELEDPSTVDDPAIAALDRTLTLAAFKKLPERWQTVLWYSEVEGMDPHEIAPFLGMTPNATAALAYRARAGLREAWLQAHLNTDSIAPECRWSTERLSGYVADKLTPRERKQVADHLATCTKCTIIAGELEHFGSHLAFVLIPLLIGSVAAPALIAAMTHGSSIAAQAGAATAAPPVHLAAFTSRAVGHVSHASHTGWIVAAVAATIVIAGAGTAFAITAAHGPATHSVAAPQTSSAPAAVPTVQPTATPTPAPIVPAPVATVVPVLPVVHHAAVPSIPAVTDPVVLTSPSISQTVQTSSILSGTGVPSAVVTISEGGSAIGSTTVDSAGNWTVSVPVAEGPNSLVITEQSGSAPASATVGASITRVPPPVDVTTTASSVGNAVSPFSLTGTGVPGDTVTVAPYFSSIEAPLGTTVVDSSGNWTMGPLVGFDPATLVLAVAQTDGFGGASAPYYVNGFALTPVILSPAAIVVTGSTATINVTGWPGATVQLTLTGEVVGQAIQTITLGAGGTGTFTLTGLAPDTYTAEVAYTDSSGNVGNPFPDATFTVS